MSHTQASTIPPSWHLNLWAKVRRIAGRVPMAPDALAAYFCMLDDATPAWAKASIGGALAYFMAPWDAIPDLLGPPGYADDAAVLAAVIVTVDTLLRPEHHRRAREALGLEPAYPLDDAAPSVAS